MRRLVTIVRLPLMLRLIPLLTLQPDSATLSVAAPVAVGASIYQHPAWGCWCLGLYYRDKSKFIQLTDIAP